MLQIRIPRKNKEFFNLYVNGRFVSHTDIKEKGHLFCFSDTVILQYKYPHHRRAYIVTQADNSQHLKRMYLPNVKQPVAVIYFISGGRRIDHLRQGIFNLEKMAGKDIYTLPIIFWQEFSCLLDTYNGYKSAAIKSNLIVLLQKYGMGEKND